MNKEILRLLAEAGVTQRVEWRDIVMLFNYAPIPPPVVRGDTLLWHRGLNLAVLSHGQPAFFAKCRPVGDVILQRETEIRSCLAGDRRGGLSVAPVRGAASDRIAVQVSPFLRGPHYGKIVTGQTLDAYVQTLRLVLDGAAELATIALRDGGVTYASDTVILSEAAAYCLADVAKLATLDEPQQAALAAAVRDVGVLPSRPQHGDFWWQNLLMVDGHLWAIDFDGYGEVCVPLYDDLTLICSTLGWRGRGKVEGPVRLISDDPEGQACRRVLMDRAVSESLSPSQLDGVLAYYVSHMASTVWKRNAGPAFSGPHIAAVRHVATRLAAGERGLLAPR